MFVKVCGLSTAEAVRAAVDAGADAIGFVLTASPREVTPVQAADLLMHVPAGVQAVGVFRHEAVEDIISVAREAGLQWIQLHGERTPADVQAAHDAGLQVIRAVTMASGPEAFGNWGEEFLLIDAAVPGSGEAWDYGSVLAKGLEDRNWLLAGGLDAHNVAQAAREAGAPGVDVSSGVESSRGIKDLAKVTAFVLAARG